jgi:hypothetical protein
MRSASLLLRAGRPLVVALGFLLAVAAPTQAGVTPYSQPGEIDFDAAMHLLNPYGTWAQTGGKWAWTPLNHAAPYTDGRWLYTEFGWYWKGNAPTSWLTEHYGYWKRDGGKVWAWYPGPVWLPQTVEMRASPQGVGWRSGEVDSDGNFVEPAEKRLTQVDEWNFVTPAQFAGPITPAVIARGAEAEQLLEDSTDSIHSYLTYRWISRPGPHPAPFLNLGDGGMFAPMTAQERKTALHPKTPAQPIITDVNDQPGDPHQVAYWVTLFLPTRWTPRPTDAGIADLYIYRPDFYQDQDGIERRIALWLNPSLRSAEAIHLQDVFSQPSARPTAGAQTNGPAVAAMPAGPSADDNALASPFDQPIRPMGSKTIAKPARTDAAGASTNVVPAGRADQQ